MNLRIELDVKWMWFMLTCKMKNCIIFLFIHVVVPIIGIIVYIISVKRIKKKEITNAPITQLFWLFGTYGVLFILVLTAILWKWSGMASIGAFASLTIGLIIAGASASSVYKHRNLTKYHKLVYWLALGYIGIILMAICSSLIYNGFK